jgi:hypothetical protein
MSLITTKGSYMLRKIASLSVALIVAGGVMVAVPAQAATKVTNGVACKKSGSTVKVGKVTYKCAKNPLMSSTKLTYLTLDCLKNANSAVMAQKTANTTAAKFKAQIPVIELGITTEIANRAEVQVKLDAATLRLTGAQAKLAAATTDVDKRVLTTAVASWTSATRAYGSKIRSIDQLIKQLEASKLVALNKPAELASNVTNARENAKLICYKGL